MINNGFELEGELVLDQDVMGKIVMWCWEVVLLEKGRKEWFFVYGFNWGTE